ncbi:MAG TPA: hypothetical protein VGC10_09705 [Sphingomonas sp.]
MRIPGRFAGDRTDGGGDSPSDERRDATRHRVRVGVTGLAVVFLLTILAASLFSLLGQDDRGTTRLANGAIVANGAEPSEAPKEPLAELGVAPGNLPGNTLTPAPAIKPPPHK